MSVKKRSFIASVGALSGARAISMASQILVLPILARHLSPVEFGLAALAMSVAILANMLSDGGMGRSLIRTPLEKQDEWTSVFWFLTALGLGLCLLVLALTPAMVWLFAEPDLFWPLAALSSMPLIMALNAPFAAEMEQRERFAELALAQTAATAAGLVVAVYMAVTGFGVWALIIQQILLNGIVMGWSVVRSRFRPGLSFSRAALGTHFAFGRDTATASLVGYLREQSTPLVIGKVLGTADLGIFAMATRFLRLPVFGLAGPAGRVIYVRLTQVRDDPSTFRETLLAAIRLLSFVILPSMATISMISQTAFTLFLSERWAEVAPIFSLAAGGAALTALTLPVMLALTALGLTLKHLRLTIEITIFWLVLLAASAGFGLMAIAAARTIWMVVMLPRHWAYLRPSCGLTAPMFLQALLPGAIISAILCIFILLIINIADLSSFILIFSVIVMYIIIMAISYIFMRHHIRQDLRTLGHTKA